jgi:hypothetical protein
VTRGHPRCERLDTLALARQQQATQVERGPLSPLLVTPGIEERFQEPIEALLPAARVFHGPYKDHFGANGKKNVTR